MATGARPAMDENATGVKGIKFPHSEEISRARGMRGWVWTGKVKRRKK